MSYFSSVASRVVACVMYLLIGVPTGLYAAFLLKTRNSVVALVLLSLLGSLLLATAAVTAIFANRVTGYLALLGGLLMLALYAPLTLFYVGHTAGMAMAAIMLTLLVAGAVVYPLTSILVARHGNS